MLLLNSTNTLVSQNSFPLPLANATEWSIDTVWTATTPSNVTCNTGKAHVYTVTFPALAAATTSDYIVLTTPEGVEWAIALNVAGTDPAPTGARWAAVNSARKCNVDISGCTTAASVAAAVELAFDALTSVPFATDDGTADGNMTFTASTRGPCAAGVTKNANDSGAGSITSAQTTTGVASAVNVTDNTLTISSHGLITGVKFALSINSGSLPAGTSATNYFAIAVDSNTVKLATSYANAVAGTVVDITDQGTADKTITLTPTTAAATMKLQCSNDAGTWHDISGATQDLATSGTKLWDSSMTASMPKGVSYLRAVTTQTSGTGLFDIVVRGIAKERQ